MVTNIYEALIQLIGQPPLGFEWVIYLCACIIVMMVLVTLCNVFVYLFKWIGGIR